MRICILKKTGELLEAQSDATEGTLILNAVSMGYSADEVEEKVVTRDEFDRLIAAPTAPSTLTAEQKLANLGLTVDDLKSLLS